MSSTKRSCRDAYYLRVSSKSQHDDSQRGDMERYAERESVAPEWFTDTFTGKTMDRPQFNRLMEAVRSGNVNRIVVWRLDRLGRTAAGLCQLFEELQALRCTLVSIRDSFDLATPSGRLMAHILASVAAYETEVRAERVRAGQQAAKARGKRIGGSAPGRRVRVTIEKEAAVLDMHEAGKQPTAISKAVGLSRPTIYRIIRNNLAHVERDREAQEQAARADVRRAVRLNNKPVAFSDEQE